MTQKEKIVVKFKNNPTSLKYNEIKTLLFSLWFEQIDAKWSHVKFKKKWLSSDIVLPIHNNDCKDFYKKQTLKNLTAYNLI